MSRWDSFKAFFQRPIFTFIILLIIATVILAQCIMTILITTNDESKKNLQNVTIGTLVMAALIVIYTFFKLLCGYIPLVGRFLVCRPFV